MSENEQKNGGGSSFALTVRRAALLPEAQWTDERIGTIARTIAPKGASAPDIAMFLAVATRYDLDPFVGEIWLAEDKGRLIIITGQDSILKVARRDDGYLGHEFGAVYANDDFRLIRKGREVEVEHVVNGFDRGALVGAFCVARKEGHPPALIMRARTDYNHLNHKNNWKSYPEDMLLARVVTAAHRKLYNISGLYTTDELESGEAAESLASHDVAAKTKTRLDGLREKLSRPAPADDVQDADYEIVDEPEGPPANGEAPAEEKQSEHDAARGRFWAVYKEAGYSTDVVVQEQARHDWTERHVGKRSIGQMSTAELRQLISLLERGEGPGREEAAGVAEPGAGLPFSD